MPRNTSSKRKKKYNEMKYLIGHAQKIAQRYYISNVINVTEMNDKEKIKARTLTHTLNGTVVEPHPMDMYALTKLRHRWSVQTGVLCREQTGKIYFDKVQEMNLVEDELNIHDVKSYISQTLFDSWECSNPLNKLTMYWLMSPIPDHRFTMRQAVAPIYVNNVLGEMLTKYEHDNPEHTVKHLLCPTLDDFITYLVGQS